MIAMAVAAVAILFPAAMAGACPQPRVALQNGQAAGRVGSTVGVNGTDMGAGVVEIRWNSQGGQKLGEAMGPNFSVNVAIPDSPPGVHYIVAANVVGSATATVAFEVTEASEPTTPASDAAPQTDGKTSANASGAQDEPVGQTATTSPKATQDPDPQEGRVTTSPVEAGTASTAPAPADANRSHGQSLVSAPSAPVAGKGVGTPAKVSSGSANPPALVTPSGQVLFGGSHAEAVSLDAGGVLTGAAGTVSGDTWTGVSSAMKPSLLLDTQLTPSTGPSPTGPAPAVGIVLVGAGLIAMLGGFTVAEVRRKAALAAAR